jgi:hypothetical protein
MNEAETIIKQGRAHVRLIESAEVLLTGDFMSPSVDNESTGVNREPNPLGQLNGTWKTRCRPFGKLGREFHRYNGGQGMTEKVKAIL